MSFQDFAKAWLIVHPKKSVVYGDDVEKDIIAIAELLNSQGHTTTSLKITISTIWLIAKDYFERG